MTSARYKTLLAYLPGMASVVNSFQSQEVQLAVYNNLMDALNERETSDGKTPLSNIKPVQSQYSARRVSIPSQESMVLHDLVEGANIHTDMNDD
jgi:hypothetical protein